jgi:outer membrane protein OmpA-like peptidoglycan-associated protein
MKKTLISLSIAGALTLASCASVPRPAVPDGSDRMPINSSAKIDDYKSRTAEETANYNERTVLARQVDGLTRQIAELKAYMVLLQMEGEANRPKARPAPVTQAPEQVPGDAGESIEVRAQAIVFRVTHPFAKSDFNASAALREQLLKAARESKHIEIRGRTDAQNDSVINRDIASHRALNARRFLVRNGIDPGKIRWSYMAVGGHVADNQTLQGNAQNRRVEIETMDMDTAPFKLQRQGPVTVGRSQ